MPAQSVAITGSACASASDTTRGEASSMPVVRCTNTSAIDIRLNRASGNTSNGFSTISTRSATPAARASCRCSMVNARSTCAPASTSSACGNRSITSFQRTISACWSPLVPGLNRLNARNTTSSARRRSCARASSRSFG